MTESLLGLTVTRMIPPEVFMRLATGEHKLHGGVIRWAAGTPQAGQIVRHLIPVATQSIEGSLLGPVSSGLQVMNAYQLHRLSGQVNNLTLVTQQVLQIATGTMILSGLNLLVSAVGFAVLNQKLNRLEGRLNEIQKEVKAIRALLEMEERARLVAALRDLLNIEEIPNPDHRRTMLFNAKNVLAPISLKYRELLAGAETLETAVAYEEYYCLTSLAHARCLAELGMLNMARRDLEETATFWQEQGQRIATDFLLGQYPERLLFSDFVQHVPSSVLVEWLDFTCGEERGYAWIDELRGQTPPWYSSRSYRKKDQGPGRGVFSSGTLPAWRRGRAKTSEIDLEREQIIPSFQKLVARSNVIAGYVAQYELLEAHSTTPSEFEVQVALLGADAAVDGFLILQPADTQPAFIIEQGSYRR